MDSLLAIPELNAVQWVPGAGREGFAEWVPVYRRIQFADKGKTVPVRKEELPLVFDTLRPEGTWLFVEDVTSVEEAEALLKRIEQWDRG